MKKLLIKFPSNTAFKISGAMILEAVDKPLEGIVHEERDVTVYLQRSGCVGKGTLYVAEKYDVKKL